MVLICCFSVSSNARDPSALLLIATHREDNTGLPVLRIADNIASEAWNFWSEPSMLALSMLQKNVLSRSRILLCWVSLPVWCHAMLVNAGPYTSRTFG